MRKEPKLAADGGDGVWTSRWKGYPKYEVSWEMNLEGLHHSLRRFYPIGQPLRGVDFW